MISNVFVEHGLAKPILRESVGGIEVTIFGNKGKVTEKDLESDEKTREKIVRLIKENNKITMDELAIASHITLKGIEWNISQLKLLGVIRRVGADRGGHWEIVENRKEVKNEI